jgi:hypothetical protein
MAPQIRIKVRPFPNRKEGKSYTCEVLEIEKNKDPQGILVRLRHLSPSQAGRTFSVLLPLEVYPEGLASDFFRSCGIEVVVGSAITPSNAIGKTLLVRFARNNDGQYEAVSFNSIEESTHGS